jgi:TIR domain
MSKAVFLSYASQDAEVVAKICAAGIEVWFDQEELVGGDAWDAKIRKQIKECALFMPVISAAAQARREGYFRREWKLAVDRTHDMDEGLPFLMPVVIDATSDAGAFVPDKFRELQWTRSASAWGGCWVRR